MNLMTVLVYTTGVLVVLTGLAGVCDWYENKENRRRLKQIGRIDPTLAQEQAAFRRLYGDH